MKTRIWGIITVAGLLATWPALAGEPSSSQTVQGVVKAPISEVWKVFSTPEGFKKIGAALCEMDFRIGGLIRSHYNPKGTLGDEGTIQNEILAFEPEHMVSFRIQKPPKGFPFAEETWKQTWSVVTLTDLGEGQTHVRITGMGYPATEDGAKMRKFFEDGNGWTMKYLQSKFDAASTKATGPAHASSPLAPITLERTVELPRDQVWKMFTTSEGWKQTMSADSNIELRPGGRFELLFGPDAPKGQQGSEGCTVLSYLPSQMVSFTWNAPPKFEHARSNHTWVVVHFDELAPARTRIRIEHLGFAEKAAEQPDHRGEWEQVRAYFQLAWPKVLDAIKGKENKAG
jgi:uncharacterized protein YndB with AHSA1/START domain